MNEYMNQVLKLTEKYADDMEKIAIDMEAEVTILRVALAKSLRYYSVTEFNNVFHKKWDNSQCREIEKKLAAYCYARAIKIRKCLTNDERFGSVNSYPLTAWHDFLENKYEQIYN